MIKRVPFKLWLTAVAIATLGAISQIPWTSMSEATGPHTFTSEGCDGFGFSDDWSPSGVSSYTEAEVVGTSTGCAWVYLSGNYQDTEEVWHYGEGPGWVENDYVGDAYLDAQAANYVGHSACNPGGACSSAVFAWSSYPPGY